MASFLSWRRTHDTVMLHFTLVTRKQPRQPLFGLHPHRDESSSKKYSHSGPKFCTCLRQKNTTRRSSLKITHRNAEAFLRSFSTEIPRTQLGSLRYKSLVCITRVSTRVRHRAGTPPTPSSVPVGGIQRYPNHTTTIREFHRTQRGKIWALLDIFQLPNQTCGMGFPRRDNIPYIPRHEPRLPHTLPLKDSVASGRRPIAHQPCC